MARHSSLRASDADRDAVAERLRRAAVEGRLEPDELEQRLHLALRARTYGELDRLLADLPAQPVPWRPRSSEVAPVARMAVVVAARLVVMLAVVSIVLVVLAMSAAWWVLGLLVWLCLRPGRRYRPRRLAPSQPWPRPPHLRRQPWQRPPHFRRV
jgi:hypothetical protein